MLRCDDGYLFSNGYDALIVVCEEGRWSIEEGEKCRGEITNNLSSSIYIY